MHVNCYSELVLAMYGAISSPHASLLPSQYSRNDYVTMTAR